MVAPVYTNPDGAASQIALSTQARSAWTATTCHPQQHSRQPHAEDPYPICAMRGLIEQVKSIQARRNRGGVVDLPRRPELDVAAPATAISCWLGVPCSTSKDGRVHLLRHAPSEWGSLLIESECRACLIVAVAATRIECENQGRRLHVGAWRPPKRNLELPPGWALTLDESGCNFGHRLAAGCGI